MAIGLIGKKLGMTQVFNDDGEAVPVTVIEAGPCVITQRRTLERDGYAAVQLGFDETSETSLNKPEKGHLAKAEAPAVKVLQEFRVDQVDEYELGDELTVEELGEVDRVDVTGTSKGKGFSGAIKRHGFSRGPETHGSRYHRGPGSLGASATPSRVKKGRKLPGRMGGSQVTVQNLEVVRIDADRNLVMVKGSIPGPKKAYVSLRPAE